MYVCILKVVLLVDVFLFAVYIEYLWRRETTRAETLSLKKKKKFPKCKKFTKKYSHLHNHS